MPDESKQDDDPEYAYPGGCINPSTEALVVQQLMGEKHGVTLRRLHRDLDDLEPGWVDESIESLELAGVVFVSEKRLHGTPAMRRLDDLDMICI